MKFRNYTCLGIIIRRVNKGEADRILTVYTKEFGKLRLLAKGVRKPKSRKRGHVEIFNKVKLSLSKTQGLDIVTEALVVGQWKDLKKSLKKISVAYFFAETIDKITNFEEVNSDLYRVLENYLQLLSRETHLKDLREKYISDVLELLGFLPKGVKLPNPDQKLQEIVERKFSSIRVGQKIAV